MHDTYIKIKKKRGYLKSKINELETHSKKRITRDWYIHRNEFKTG